MAEITPFKGILYHSDDVHDLSLMVTPPFDVISKEDQCHFHECHPHNVIRLILGNRSEADSPADNCHTRSATCLNQWLSEGILARDKAPAFYLTTMTFLLEERSITRFGLIARIRLEPFEKGVVLPHERTFSKVRSERLELMKACHANLSPIFALYSDQEGILSSLTDAVSDKTPVMAFMEANGHRHSLWRITDIGVHQHISRAMAGKRIFIADGHHRYETALAYRDWVAETDPQFSEDHPANHVMMYLASMEDPGVIIRPAHRMLKAVPESAMARFLQKARDYFDIVTIPYGSNGGTARTEFLSDLGLNPANHTIGVCMKDARDLCLLKLKPGVMERMFGHELPATLMHIDVTVLTRLIFMEILGFDQVRLDNEKLIGYSSVAEEAIDAVTLGKWDISFILNPTRIEQMREVAEKGLIMPRKATYFYPKVIAGQVINPLS